MLVTHVQTNFTSGELGPRLYGRTDLDRYGSGAARVENFLPLPYGPLLRRSGTRYVASTKSATAFTRLIPFKFSENQAYVLEFGDLYVRFYRDRDQIMNDGSLKSDQTSSTPYEIVSPYDEADLLNLRFVQSNDVLYLTHPNVKPYELRRLGDIDWKFVVFDYKDGPYDLTNTSKVTLAPSAATGTGITIVAAPNSKTITGAANNGSGLIRITAVAHGFATGDPVNISGVLGTTEANGNWEVIKVSANAFDLKGSVFANTWSAGGTQIASANVFASTDVGRHVRIKNGGAANAYGWAIITAFTNTFTVTADVRDDFAGTSANKEWRLGAWSDTLGWPTTAVFHHGRLVFGRLQTIWASVTGDFESFAPTSPVDGSVAADNAIYRTLDDNSVNAIRWLQSDTAGLLIGTTGGVFSGAASTQGSPITPSDFTVIRQNNEGADDYARPQRAGAAVVYAQRFGNKVGELIFSFETARFATPDMTLLAEHMTDTSPIVDLEFQQEPFRVIWAIRNDGRLLSMTYEREQSVVAWAKHFLGGELSGGDTQAKSLAVIPDEPDDLLWLIVRRTINGQQVQYVEYLEDEFGISQDITDAHFVDASIVYNGTPMTTIAGLSHLEGQQVAVLADGAVQGMTEVAGGTITLAQASSIVHVGLPYRSLLKTLPITPKSGQVDPRGKLKALAKGVIQFHQTMNGQAGQAENQLHPLDPLIFRQTTDPMGEPAPLFTGAFSVLTDGTYEVEPSLYIVQDSPLPMTVVSITQEMDIGGTAG